MNATRLVTQDPPCVDQLTTSFGRAELMGSVGCDHTELEAGGLASLTLVYRCGTFGIDDLGGLLIAFRSANDQTALQTTDPASLGFVSAEASSGAPLEVRFDARGWIRPWFKALSIRVKQFLREGDTITVRIGDRRGGSPGFRVQTFCESRYVLPVFVDPIATGRFAAVANPPILRVRPGTAERWRLIAPTQRRAGTSFWIGFRAEDKWGNPTAIGLPSIFLRAEPAMVAGLPPQVELAHGADALRIEDLRVDVPGDVALEARAPDGRVLARANVLRVTGEESLEHFWSDLHGQSEETIGTNSADEYFAFGRDKAFLDICAHQANDFQITDAFWKHLNQLTGRFNEPGTFVTLPGYEWSGNTGVGGDHNVWYRSEGRTLWRSSHAMVDDHADLDTDRLTAKEMFETLRAEDALVTAHCGGRYADVKYAHDARLEPSVEIHSCWGTFEWILRDALESGYRVGIVGASDDHKGRPGASHPGASKFGAYGGLTCHLMTELSRDGLFDSFRRRHHYATTGARVWLSVRARFSASARIFDTDPSLGPASSREADIAIMGDIVQVDAESFVLEVEAASASPIERIELRDGLEVLEVVRPHAATTGRRSRIRVIWEGAETRGRSRNAVWDGTAAFVGNAIRHASSINFWNAERPLRRVGESGLAWSSFTTGSFSGFDAWLASERDGTLRVVTPVITIDLPVADIGLEDRIFDAGGLGKHIRVFRLPDENPCRSVAESRRLALRPDGDTRPYVCVTFEDGHRAWSSPLYLFRR
jgi:Protein of unknown function (DUF3604)